MLYMNPFGLNMLKTILFKEIEQLMKESVNKNILKDKIELLKSIVNDFSSDNYDELYYKSEILPLTLPMIFEVDEANEISNILRISLYNLRLSNKYDVKKNLNDFSKTLEKFKVTLDDLEKQYEKIKDIDYETKITNYRRIISNFKFGSLITDEEYKIIDDIITKKGIKEKDQIRILENIKNHNLYIKYKCNDEKSTIADRKTILNMLDLGYEEFPEINVLSDSSRKRIDSVELGISNVLKEQNISSDTILESLPDLKSLKYSYEEFCAIIITILKKLQQEINFDADAIATREFYDNKVIRETTKLEYIQLQNKYNLIRNYYEEQITNYEQSIIIESDTNLEKNNLFYIGEVDEAFIEKDLKKLPNEYLYKIELLLKKLKMDMLSISERKNLTGAEQLRGLKELRDDQVRIIFYHVSDNNFVIVGCGLKKSDNLRRMYNIMATRSKYIDINNEEKITKEQSKSKLIEQRLFDYINKNKRTGTR